MRKRITLLVLSLCSIMVSMSSHAVTSVSGTITEDTVWTVANGPYRVVGSIKVAPGATLTIEGGTTAYGDANEITFLSNLLKSHETHFDQTGKGPGITECNTCHNAKFKDNLPLETTTVCDGCHSPGGSYPGPLGAMDPNIGNKANFRSGGVYENDGVTLKPGKEKWCSTCHDSVPSENNLHGFYPTYAPNVVGDDTTYGFWQTGHGKSIDNCLECHDAGKDHWDYNQRTYEVDETTKTAINGWGDSYRLRTKSSKSSEQLCVKCHDQSALRNVDGQSNFKKDGSQFASAHELHVWGANFSTDVADTDYDSVGDSRPTCTVCHNPHGSKSNKMTRTGELASTQGTTDRTPALDQLYLKPAPGPFSTATWRPNLPYSGVYGVYGWWKKNGGLGIGEYTIYHDGGSSTITKTQTQTGGEWVSLGSYNFSAGTSGYVELSARLSTMLLIADKMGFDSNGDGVPDIVIDDTDPEFSSVDEVNGGSWPDNAWSEGKAINYNEGFITAGSLEDSTAGYVRFGSATVGWNKGLGGNYVCDTCHGAIIYQREPYMGPKVINRFEDRRWALNDGNGTAEVVVSVVDPNDDMFGGTVTIDATALGGGYAEAMTDNGDNTYSYLVDIPFGVDDVSYALPITAVDAAGNVGSNLNASVFVTNAADTIYLDNADTSQVHPDTWGRDNLSMASYRGSYMSTYNFKSVPEYEIASTWETSVEKTGSYAIYVWLQASSIFNTDAVYTVEDSNGVSNIAINQNTGPSGGGWVYVGTYDYEAGAKATITLSGANYALHNQLYVDALKLELVP